MLFIRSLLFYACLIPLAIFFGGLCLVLWIVPYAIRHRILIGFNWFALKSLQLCCGISVEVRGQENIPDQPVVIMAKHQSTFETFFLQLYFAPLSTILKQELLRIPFFGWGLALLRPIAIDRGNPRAALKKVKTEGMKRLEEGNNVLVFPEGTRTPLGQVGNYARSGADIAIAANAPVLAIAHNAGLHWPMHTLTKHPGKIQVSIGEPIYPEGRNSREMTEEVKNWIEAQIADMPDAV
ncbi:1-acyl-sn-glycerol-3-phosphate acyltransferase [Maricurvus nonylphenolicus]|uniref:lysophospholipid acyltransferase family protein n=1 Tax=Maricurvus nonylphenolicus TaxID=1008307 RepID=UPI0036F3623C